MDVNAIRPGRDFRKAIDEQQATNAVCCWPSSGQSWLESKDGSGQRRLDDENDFVRIEIASALERDITVIPVLVRGARMPRAEQLPKDLRELAFRNAVELTHYRWRSDVQVPADPGTETLPRVHRRRNLIRRHRPFSGNRPCAQDRCRGHCRAESSQH